MAATLPKHPHEPQKVRVCAETLDQQMKVIWHEAVRKYFNAVGLGSTQKLVEDRLDSCVIDKVFVSMKGAHREEDTVGSDVQSGIELNRSAMQHAASPEQLK